MMHRRAHVWPPFKSSVFAFGGVGFVLALLWAAGPGGQLLFARLTTPRPPEMPSEDSRAVMAMTTRAEHRRLSDDDWELLKTIYVRDHHDSACFGPMRVLPRDFSHRDEAIGILKGYIREGHRGGNVIAVIGLRTLDAPGWRECAKGLLSSEDAQTRSLAQRAFAAEWKG